MANQRLTKELEDYKSRVAKLQKENQNLNQSKAAAETQTDPFWKQKKHTKQAAKWLPLVIFVIMLVIKILISYLTVRKISTSTNTEIDVRTKTKKSRKIKVRIKLQAETLYLIYTLDRQRQNCNNFQRKNRA